MTYFQTPGVNSISGQTGDVTLTPSDIKTVGINNARVIGTGSSPAGSPYGEIIMLSGGTSGSTIPQRTASGQVLVSTATLANAAVPLGQSPTLTVPGVTVQGAAATDIATLLTSLRNAGVIAP